MAKSEYNRAERYELGKTIKDEEFGTLFPDGTIRWDDYQARSPESRKAAREEWENQIRHLRIPHPGDLRFVKRTKKTTFTEVSFL